MNKARIDSLLPFAYEAIRESGIPDGNGTVMKTFRGQISTFGAAVSMGSLLAAIAFFSDRGGADVDRTKLMDAVFGVLKKAGTVPDGSGTLFAWAEEQTKAGKENACREEILSAAIAVKLAMNLYPLRAR